MSIAGGMDRAIERGAAIGCTAIQIFTKSSNQWAARPLPDDEVERFRAGRERAGLTHVVAHDSYLINLCSPDDRLFRKSIDAYVEEMQRCLRLGVSSLVTHPGAHVGQGEAFGIRRMAEAIDAICERVPDPGVSIVLETTAGQGTVIGRSFEELAAIIASVRHPERLGVCFDTCHVFAAGYDLRSRAAYDDTMRRFAGEIGFERLRAVHLNDSKKDLGCRVDRHEHIGKGFLGLEAFRHVMNDARLADRPMLLETPKDDDCREDVENLTILLGLVGADAAPAGRDGRAPEVRA
jgi:deoxyribonuclease-4